MFVSMKFFESTSKTYLGALIFAFFVAIFGGVIGAYLYAAFVSVSESQKIEAPMETTAIQQEDSATIAAVQSVQDAVVSIVIEKEISKREYAFEPFGDSFFFSPLELMPIPETNGEPYIQEVGGGTGFIISSDGLILTNRHVVRDSDATYSVITNQGERYTAEVLGKDPINDLAVIKIEAADLPTVSLGDSDSLVPGQTVIAIGNSLAEFNNTVTRGVISGINRRVTAGGGGVSEVLEAAIQTDAAINPGNSGGPLINLRGEVVGVNTAVSVTGQSIGFAIPINEAKQVIESVKKHGRIVRPFLGVRYLTITEQIAKLNDLPVSNGALLVEGEDGSSAVVPDSPADEAGLVTGDIITHVNGEELTKNKGLARALAQYDVGEEVTFTVIRDEDEFGLSATLVERK